MPEYQAPIHFQRPKNGTTLNSKDITKLRLTLSPMSDLRFDRIQSAEIEMSDTEIRKILTDHQDKIKMWINTHLLLNTSRIPIFNLVRPDTVLVKLEEKLTAGASLPNQYDTEHAGFSEIFSINGSRSDYSMTERVEIWLAQDQTYNSLMEIVGEIFYSKIRSFHFQAQAQGITILKAFLGNRSYRTLFISQDVRKAFDKCTCEIAEIHDSFSPSSMPISPDQYRRVGVAYCEFCKILKNGVTEIQKPSE
jgi:hypothetical protein